MSSSQTNVLVLANAEGAAAAQTGELQKTVATTQAPAKKDAFSEKPTAGELIEFQATGLLVVFVVLGAITGMSALLSKLLKTFLPKQYYGKTMPPPASAPVAKPVAPVAPAASVASVAPAGLSQDKVLVLLTAAAHEVFGSSASVVSFRPVGSSDTLWSVQGRAAHHSSHKL